MEKKDDLAIYITTKNQRVASRILQGVTNKLDTWAAGSELTFSPNKTVSMTFRKRRQRNEESIEIMLRNKIISKESTHFFRDDTRQQIKLGGTYQQIKSKQSIIYYKGGSMKDMGKP